MIKIVPATISDNEEIRKVRRITWLDTYPNEELGITTEDVESEFLMTPQEEEEYKALVKKRYSDPNNRCLIAKEDDKIVGFSVSIKGEEFNRILAFYVLPEYQGKGIGRMLMEESLNWLGDRKDILVNVASYNEKAQRFYRKFGFELTGKDVTDPHHPLKTGKVIPEEEMKKPAN